MTAILAMLLAFSFQTQAKLSDPSQVIDDGVVTAEEQERREKVLNAYHSGDFQTFMDEAEPQEIGDLIRPFIVNGTAERISENQAFGYKHIFAVHLNNNQPGQSMIWMVNNRVRKSGIKVSGARRGKVTPRGLFAVHNVAREAFSASYDNSPMPCSLFFHNGGKYAIHGTGYISKLGSPASAGCIRVDPRVLCPIWDEIVRNGEQNSVLVQVYD